MARLWNYGKNLILFERRIKMEWLIILGLLLLLSLIPLRNYLFGSKRKTREMRKIYKVKAESNNDNKRKNHSSSNCCN
jgi:hypothetical protein